MSTPALGRLERVELRKAWTSEADDFTPWLAQPENIRLLGDAISLVLTVQAQEEPVGPFRADILCRAEPEGTVVLIENQLEKTDHKHLGQLMTYAAGLHAANIVWIAERFTDEHRAALDWLNESTNENINFFGLEIELWRIGNSPVAPKFNIVCQPNDWAKAVRPPDGAVTEAGQLRLAYWTAFREFIERNKTDAFRPTKTMSMAFVRSGFVLAAVASLWNSQTNSYDTHELRAELVVQTRDSKAAFNALHSQRAEIEAKLGEALVWHNPPNARMCRIYLRRDADIRNEADWPNQHAWLKSKLEAICRVFGPVVRDLEVPEEGEPEGQSV
jgi:hypothetical protein